MDEQGEPQTVASSDAAGWAKALGGAAEALIEAGLEEAAYHLYVAQSYCLDAVDAAQGGAL
jgi:hypothetical protein